MSKNNGHKPAIGVDDGTYTLITARRDEDGEIQYAWEVNGFMEIPLTPETKTMLAMVERTAPVYRPADKKFAYPMGRKAQEIAVSWSSFLNPDGNNKTVFKRTMRDGIISVQDTHESFFLLGTMLHSLIGKPPCEKFPIAFAFPGQPVGTMDPRLRDRLASLNPQYHQSVIQSMLKTVGGVSCAPFGVNEAMAIIWAECQAEGYTGLAISFGAGMTNVAFAVFGMPIFTFSYVGGGDWIDENTASRCGVDAVIANRIKTGDEKEGIPGIDLTAEPTGENAYITRSIQTHYNILLDAVVADIAKFMREHKARVATANKPPVIVAGGTAQPNGFMELLEQRLRSADFGEFPLGQVRKAENGLFTVAKGLLIAAEETERE